MLATRNIAEFEEKCRFGQRYELIAEEMLSKAGVLFEDHNQTFNAAHLCGPSIFMNGQRYALPDITVFFDDGDSYFLEVKGKSNAGIPKHSPFQRNHGVNASKFFMYEHLAETVRPVWLMFFVECTKSVFIQDVRRIKKTNDAYIRGELVTFFPESQLIQIDYDIDKWKDLRRVLYA